MPDPAGGYNAWRSIDYRPAIGFLPPLTLLPFLAPGARVLDIGCGRGDAVLFLASKGYHATGLDISEPAVAEATGNATRLGASARFVVGDILNDQNDLSGFDAVLMTRVLTCFAAPELWRKLLERARTALSASGVLYVHDFLLDESDPQYGPRYQAGLRENLTYGSFHVYEAGGRPLFVAHHHTDAELAELAEPYETLAFHRHASLSMHGNRCSMFEFVGRRR